MSWSDNRSNDSSNQRNWEEKRARLEQVNAVLGKISQDEDFYDDLKIPLVKKALDHWTGKNRLPPDEAVQLQDNRRCVYVLQRIQMLQSVCQAAGIAVPLDLLLEKKFLDIDAYRPKPTEKVQREEKVSKDENIKTKVSKLNTKSPKEEDVAEKKTSDEKANISESPASNENHEINSLDSKELKVAKSSIFGRPNNTLLIGLFFLLLYFVLSRFIEN
eukprot:gene11380-12403_t